MLLGCFDLPKFGLMGTIMSRDGGGMTPWWPFSPWNSVGSPFYLFSATVPRRKGKKEKKVGVSRWLTTEKKSVLLLKEGVTPRKEKTSNEQNEKHFQNLKVLYEDVTNSFRGFLRSANKKDMTVCDCDAYSKKRKRKSQAKQQHFVVFSSFL